MSSRRMKKTFELRSYRAWKEGQAPAMDGRKAVADAGQSKRVVADGAYHVFRLPQILSGNAAPRMECVQPGKTHDIAG